MNNDIKENCLPREYSARGIYKNAADYIKEAFEAGNVALIYADSVERQTDEITASLIDAGGFAIRTIACDDRQSVAAAEAAFDFPECVRFLVGVGGGKIADITRLAAAKRGIRYGLAPTAPSTDGYISNRVPFTGCDVGENCRFPEFLLIDEEVIERAPKRLVAAGYGRVIAQLVNIFDIEFMRAVYSMEYDDDALAELTRSIRCFEGEKEEPLFNLRLLKLLNTVSRLNYKLGRKGCAADGFAHLLSECLGGRTSGETSFIASYVVLNLYRMFLRTENIDTLLPVDVVKTLKLLEKMSVVNYNGYVSSMAVDTTDGYMKSRFVLAEYREELFSKLDGLDLTSISRFWRRLYDDAGFWLKGYANSATLLRYLSISAELADDSLLKYVKRLGFLEKFI